MPCCVFVLYTICFRSQFGPKPVAGALVGTTVVGVGDDVVGVAVCPCATPWTMKKDKTLTATANIKNLTILIITSFFTTIRTWPKTYPKEW